MRSSLPLYALIMAMCIALPGAGATCLTSQQLDYIDNLSVKLNVTSSELRIFFEPFCNQTISSYTKTETDLQMQLLNQNISSRMDAINSTVDLRMSGYFQNVTAIVNNMSGQVSDMHDMTTGMYNMQNMTLALSSLVNVVNASQSIDNISQLVDEKISSYDSKLNSVLNTLQNNYVSQQSFNEWRSNSTNPYAYGNPAPIQAGIDPMWLLAIIAVIAIGMIALYLNKGGISKRISPASVEPAEGQAIMNIDDMPRTFTEAAGINKPPKSIVPAYQDNEIRELKPSRKGRPKNAKATD